MNLKSTHFRKVSEKCSSIDALAIYLFIPDGCTVHSVGTLLHLNNLKVHFFGKSRTELLNQKMALAFLRKVK